MKKLIHILCLGIILALVSCTNFVDESVGLGGVKTSASQLEFSSSSTVQNFSVTSGEKWTIQTPDWLRVSQISGRGYSWSVSLTSEENSGYDRTGVITLQSSSSSAKINVSQQGRLGAYVPVSSVSLSPQDLVITEGETGQLTATVSPSNASNKTVTWESSATGVATVSSNGLITAIAQGSATITATTEDGGKTATCRVTVAPDLNATCAEVIAGPDNKTYRVTGICTRIVNASYGNWYLQDATGQIYIYGTVNASGSYAWSSFGIEVGDEVTVEGPKTTVNGTVELVDVQVINVSKSLIKVAEIDPENAVLPVEGGDFTVKLSNKGTGIYVEVPDNAKDWLSLKSITGNTVRFHATANAGGDRGTTLVFRTTDGKKEYFTEQTVSQKGAIIECSIAEFNAAEVGSTQYRITGVITRVANANYGNYYIRDWSGETYVYVTGAKGDFERGGWKVGDVVTVVGKRDQFKETIEMTGSTIENTIVVTEVTIADFLTKPDDKNVYYMVSGTIDKITNAIYGNLYINDGAGNRLYVYGCYPGWGAMGDNRKDAIAKYGIQVGDYLTIIAAKTTYNGEPQTNYGVFFSSQVAVHEWVDLGLPSGLKWATCNVGANSPSDYGNYYAWGETSTKSNYDWSTYCYCNGSYNSLTKYNTDSSYGTVDNRTRLEMTDDAARANWGGSWRMPTDAEWTELRNNCNWTWTTQDGKNGYRVTSRTNGNSIFLPAAGNRYESSLSNAGSSGNYWSSSLRSDYPSHAWGVVFDSGEVGGSLSDRYRGQSVRPVSE